MYYRLKEGVALRAWKFVNGAVYLRLLPAPLQVEREIFEEYFGHMLDLAEGYMRGDHAMEVVT